MGSADLPEPAATCQQNSYTFAAAAAAAILAFCHAALCMTGICEAGRDVNVLQRPTEP
jgi:hypothetical protein